MDFVNKAYAQLAELFRSLSVGARITTGLLNDGRDTFSDLVIGAKYGLNASSAVTANVAAYNEADQIGLSAGYLQFMQAGGLDISSQLLVGLLDGYAPKGVGIGLHVEPKYLFSDKLAGYVNLLLETNTDALGDNLAFDVWPNLDVMLAEGLILNAGVTVGVAGDRKQDDLGLRVAAIYLLPTR